MHSTFSNFVSYVQKNYAQIDSAVVERLTPNLISPFKIDLPKSVFKQAKAIVRELHELSQSATYQEILIKDFPFKEFQKTPSVLCSLDVHLMPNGQLKIIEINTNASSYLINLANYTNQGIATFPEARQKLLQSFKTAFTDKLKENDLVVILDEHPEAQNLYIEFLMYKEIFEKEFKVRCQIADVSALTVDGDGTLLLEGEKVSAVYNRCTDFYFSGSQALQKAFSTDKTAISPSPWGYAQLGDKRRMLMWNEEFFKNLAARESLQCPELRKALLETKKFSDFKDHDDLWVQRARYFFKPPTSHGGKMVYKGKSISRSTYQKIYDGEFLAQEAAAPPELELRHDGIEYDFKYDLRFYFFEGEIHLANARLYQGQLTNLQTAFGGLTPLEFVD